MFNMNKGKSFTDALEAPMKKTQKYKNSKNQKKFLDLMRKEKKKIEENRYKIHTLGTKTGTHR